jgi:hypothetical protein
MHPSHGEVDETRRTSLVTTTRFRPPPHWIPALALYAVVIWSLAVRPLPAAVQWDDYGDYAPPPGYEWDYYQVLRRPADRPPEADASIALCYQMQRCMKQLANATRWGEDRTVKFLLYTGHYERALSFAATYRAEFAKLLTVPFHRTIDDPGGTHTAVVLWEPIYPRHPYVKIEKVLF